MHHPLFVATRATLPSRVVAYAVLVASFCALCGERGVGRLSAQEPGPMIKAAVERGRIALLPLLAQQTGDPGTDYPMGRIALPLAAVLKAGTPPEEKIVLDALARLETLELRQTYSVACYLFALDAYWQARYRTRQEKARASRGQTAVGEVLPNLPPPGPVRKRMEECIAWLVRGKGGTWNYGGRGGGDHSNSQFAILGLEIGLQNDIEIPLEVFESIARHFVDSHLVTSTSRQFRITYKTPAWEGITSGLRRPVAYSAYVGGWGYRPDGRESTANMTAAGVSSLLVARRALERAGKYSGQLAWDVDRKIESGLGWMAEGWGAYLQGGSWAYYGLYSVEKVGDIGGIVAFDAIDWYAEGARVLLSRQGKDGLWSGNPRDPRSAAIDTAFALLFLTRATRSHLQTSGPPILFTNVAGGGEETQGDFVYIDRVGGFVSTDSIFDFLAETRDPALIPIAREAIAAHPPHRAHEILARVLALWRDGRDRITLFAREAAAEICGVDAEDRSVYDGIVEEFRAVRDWERNGTADPAKLAAMIGATRSAHLKRRAIDLVDRLGLPDAFPAVIEAIGDGDPDVRRRAYETVRAWSGKDLPAPPSEKSAGAKELETAAASWRTWWDEEGESFRRRRRAVALIERMEQAWETAAPREDAEEVIRPLVELGAAATTPIIEAMERGRFRIELVRALEKITGQSVGLRPADWRQAIGAKP